MNKQIYEPIIEEGLLKSIGPFKVTKSNELVVDITKTVVEINNPIIVGGTIMYGDNIIIEKKSPKYSQL